MRFTMLLFAGLGTAAWLGDGFAIHDLRTVESETVTLLGTGFVAKVDSARLTLICSSCTGAPMVDILLGRQTDGTEARVRAGTTTFVRLDSLCRSRNPSCRIAGLHVDPAVGWISSYRTGEQSAHTVIVLRDGDLLTIRSLASDSVAARHNVDRLVTTLVPKIVGR
jgi:hypothetical protein